MSTNKHINKICIIAVLAAFIITILFCNAESFGIKAAEHISGYETRLFDKTKVHSIDIVMNDWDSFIETCENEEYSPCSVVIDGEAYKNIGIRAKGNTSLSTVSSMDSNRYSFKLEFDQYDTTKSYYGLDKLCLNNLIQDNTLMKDYLVYTLMYDFGVSSPLCSFVYITVNGEDWGLYLAVEGIEEAFLQRNYGNNYGELYKPDSMSFGGGRGNGKDFDFDNFMNNDNGTSTNGNDSFDSKFHDFSDNSDFSFGGNFGGRGEFSSDKKGGFDFRQGGGGGMGSSDVKLQYTDDDPDSYSNIFDNAKTDISDSDKARLISSLKSLSEMTDLEETLDIEKVIRYFVVHNYVCNGDSYTGSMIHNYYLYEENGQLSMIPWDYNLAFGVFQGGNAQEQVNYPIDSPVSGGSDDRPMVNWIFENEEYTELYHSLFSEFIEYDITSLISETAALIAPYAEKDPTKFCTYEEFETGVNALISFCTLRTESVKGQLEGTIPSTSEGQSADSSSLIDASGLTISDTGNMQAGRNNGFPHFGNTDSENHPPDLPSFVNPDDANGAFPNRDGENGTFPNIDGANGTFPNIDGANGAFPNRGEANSDFPNTENNNTPPTNNPENAPSDANAPQPPSENGSISPFPDRMNSPQQNITNVILPLCLSASLLTAGLIIAFVYKR